MTEQNYEQNDNIVNRYIPDNIKSLISGVGLGLALSPTVRSCHGSTTDVYDAATSTLGIIIILSSILYGDKIGKFVKNIKNTFNKESDLEKKLKQ